MSEYAIDVLTKAIEWKDAGYGVALAGVVSTWGSSPRPPGSLMAINEKGGFVGSVSGGCIENFVVSEAIDVIKEGEPQRLEYGVSNQRAAEVRLSCGGSIQVFVERAPSRENLLRLAEGGPIARVVDLSTYRTSVVDENTHQGSFDLDDAALEKVRGLLRRNASGTLVLARNELFVTTFARQRRLIIVGAVHIAQILAPMAKSIGMDVVVLDNRPAFANFERLPGIAIVREPTRKAMQGFTLDPYSSVVVLAHDPLLDDPALHAALKSPVAYIGCLGSRRTHAQRLDRLQQAGFVQADLDRLHGPVGLDIGGSSPGEIAVSILAEIIAVLNGKRETRGDSVLVPNRHVL